MSALRTAPRSACPVCGGGGAPLHAALHDRLFGTDGEWTLVRCADPSCGLLWLDPAPLAEDLPLAYATYYTHAPTPQAGGGPLGALVEAAKRGHLARRFGYRASSAERLAGLLLLPFPTRRESLEQTLFHLPARAGGRVLEVGCGAGDSLALLGRYGWDAEGIDFDARAVAAARSRGLRAAVGDLVSRGGPANAYDAVVMAHLIEHVPDPVGLLAEAHRVLRPSGRLVVVTPNARSLGHRVFGRAWRGLEPPRHLVVFTPEALARAAKAAGFARPSLRSSARMASFLSAQSRHFRSGGTGPIERMGLTDALFQARERMGLASDQWAGEELVLEATKEDDRGA